MHRWRDYVVDSDSLDIDKYVQASYRIATEPGRSVHESAVDLLRVITHRSPDFYLIEPNDEPIPAVSNVGRAGKWTDITLAIPETYWEPAEGLGRLLELLASVAEYDYTRGTWLHRVDFSRRHLDQFTGPNQGISGLRQALGTPDRPLLAATVGPRGAPLSEQLSMVASALDAGFDLIVDDMLLGTGQNFESRVQAIAEVTMRMGGTERGRPVYLCALGGRPSQAMRRAAYALDVGAGGFVINPFVSGFDFVEDIAHEFPNAYISCTNMGSGMVSRPTTVTEDAGIDEQVFSKFSRLSGADAVHAGTTGTSCYDVDWRDAIRALYQPLRRGADPIKPSFRVAEGGIDLINIWPNMRILGNDTLFEINSSVSFAERAYDSAAEFVSLVSELTSANNRSEAWDIYIKFARKNVQLAAQLKNNEGLYESWI